MSKYPWAVNQNKLQRAIEKVRVEQHTGEKREARIKELYISYGGLLNLAHSLSEKENDPTDDKEGNSPTKESGPDLGGQGSTDDVPLG